MKTIFLKVVLLIIGLPVLAICIFWVPGLAGIVRGQGSAEIYLIYPVFLAVYVSALVFFFALYQAFCLLNYIDKNTAFSDMSIKALKKIKNCGVGIAVLYAVAMPFVYILAEMDDAPGLILVGLIMIFAALVIASFAAVLEALLKSVIEIKQENELTV